MNLKKLVAASVIFLGMTVAYAQNEAPAENPSAVMVKGRLVSHSWRNGRIWVPTSDLQPLLNMSSEHQSMDLLKALEEKGGYVWTVVDGRFEAKLDPSKFSQASNSVSSSSGNTAGADYRAAEQRMQKALMKYPKLESHRELERVERIGQKLVAVSDMPSLKWNFLVVRGADPNAFCAGAGWVAVTDGLLALKLSDNELAGVLAHEIGHGCRKDLEEGKFNREQMARYEGEARKLDQERQVLLRRREDLLSKAQQALRLANLSGSSGQSMAYHNEAQRLKAEAESVGRKISKLDRSIETAVKNYKGKEMLVTESVFQHKDEYDADIKGIYYATRAGYSSTGLMDCLKKIAQADAEKFGLAAYQGGFSHPPVGDRIKTMNKVLKDWRDQR